VSYYQGEMPLTIPVIEQASPLKSETGNAAPCVQEDVTGLLSNTPTLKNLQKLTLFSTNNALPLDMEDADRNEIVQRRAMWEEDALFDRMFDGLMVFLDPKQPAGLLEQAVVLLWEMVQNQWCLCETREDALLDAVFKLRSSTNPVILESTNSLVSLLTEVCDPPFLLSLLHSALDRFLAAHISEVNKVGENEVHGERAIAAGYNFGLNAMGMCIIHLPKEVVELEAKRLEKQVMAVSRRQSSFKGFGG
jgi:CLIP-associating protein 1/2